MKKDSKKMLREIGDYCIALGTGVASSALISALLNGIVGRTEFSNKAIKALFKTGAASIGIVTGLKVMKETEEAIDICHEAEDSLIELIREKRENEKQKKLSKKEES